MTQHTFAKPPWVYRPTKYDDWGTVKDGDGYVICQARDPRHRDEEHLNKCRKNKIDPWEGTARLISAAPEMLSALKICLKAEMERRKSLKIGSPASTYTSSRIAMIEAAISKAEPAT